MEVIFLGTGTSQGVPMIAQAPGSVNLANPRNWRMRSSIHVVMGATRIQVDAAQEFRLQCVREDIRDADVFILTHGHADHILGMDDLRRFCDELPDHVLPVYSTPEGLARIRQVYPYAVGERPAARGYPCFRLREMPARLELPGGVVHSVLLPHGDVQTLGLVFEEADTGKKFVYYCDCKEVGEPARSLARGAEVVVLDGLRPHAHPTHMTISEAVAVAQAINAPRTFLTHMTFQVDYDACETSLPPNIRLAYDGLRLKF
jgi:phosphoribosyl 1,2-cyclic phosphate phosphodiesterase